MTKLFRSVPSVSLCAILPLFLLTACTREAASPTPSAGPPALDPAALHGAAALQHVTDLVTLGPRDSGTPGAERAATFIAGRLRATGATVEVDTFTDPTPHGPLTFRNVIGTFAGNPRNVIVLLSHYDTKAGISPDFVGANDSGSSSGLLLALAETFRTRPTGGPTLILGFVDGEECQVAYGANDGLHGSRRLAAKLVADGTASRVRAVILLDLVGDRDLTITIPRNTTPELAALAFKAAQAEGVRERFSLFAGSMVDDHVPFLERNMPAIDLIDFEFGSAPGRNDHWHTTNDTLDKLSADSLQHVGRVVIHMLNDLSAP